MKSWAYVLDGDTGRAVEVDEALDDAGGSFSWVHLDGREEECRHWLDARADIPDGVAAALVATETRPRLEAIGDGALINLRGLGATPEDDPDPLVSIRLWATQGHVVSLTMRTIAGIDDLRRCMERGVLRDPGDLITEIAVRITQRLDPDIGQLGDALDDCEEEIGAAEAFQMRRDIARVRSAAIGYRRFVVPQRAALERLSELDAPWIEDADRLHLRGAADGFARMAEELEAIRERAALLHEQLTDLRAELIERRGLIVSVVALVFLPLTFLTGLLGMNVDGIPYAHAPWAFGAVVALCILAAAASLAYFIRAHWFA